MDPYLTALVMQMLKSYNRIWQLLLRLKRANVALLETWQSLKRPHVDVRTRAADPPVAFCLVQANLAHCINSLLRYIQVRARPGDPLPHYACLIPRL